MEIHMSRRLKILAVIGIALCVAILISVIHHYQLRFAVEKYILELKAKGEPLDLAQVIPPPVPPELNGASNFLKAASLLETNWNVLGSNPPPAMRMIAPGKAMVGAMQAEVSDGKASNSWREIESALANEREGLESFRQVSNGLKLDFNLAYSNGADKVQLSHLIPLKRAAQGLSASAICDLHQGNTASAVKNIRAMLALVNGTTHDRLLISELVRMAIAQIALSANWEFLQATNITDEELASLQQDWARQEFIRGDENALAMERVAGEMTVAEWRNSESELLDYVEAPFRLNLSDLSESAFDRFKISIKTFLWRYWWSYPDELQLLKGYQIFLQTARLSETNYSLLTALHDQENQVRNLDIDPRSVGSLYFSDVNKWDLRSLMSGSVFP